MRTLETQQTVPTQCVRRKRRNVHYDYVRSSGGGGGGYHSPHFVWSIMFILICTGIFIDVTTTTTRYYVMGNSILHTEAYDDDNDAVVDAVDDVDDVLLSSTSNSQLHNIDVHHHHSDHHDTPTYVNNDSDSNQHTATTDMCHDMYMTMYMDGFHWSLFFQHMKSPKMICLNYFVSTWKIQYPSEFRGCMIYTFLLAILLEALSSIRTMCEQYFHPATKDDTVSNTLHQHRLQEMTRHLITIILYTIQTVIGYLLMLVVMSYSIELLLSVLLGLIIGNGLFVRYHDDSTGSSNSNSEATLLDDDENDNGMTNSPYDEHQPDDEAQSLLSSSGRRQRSNDGIIIRRRG
jgi:Ctr copper transporter family